MSPEWLTAIGTIGTFVVIAGSAIAALLQLRHMRSSNQIVALTEVRETLESSEFQAALRYVSDDFTRLLADRERRELVVGPTLVEFESVRTVANFFEGTGALVKAGIIDADLACDIWGYVVLRNWNFLEEFITNLRIGRETPALFENFEYFAVLSKRWFDAHPTGTYPAGMERMPSSPPWPELGKQTNVS